MPRVIAVIIAAVLGLSTQPTDNAWAFFVDDLHLAFAQTGRLRDLLRTAAGALIQEGDRYLFRASGPSAVSLSNAMTIDREAIGSTIKFMTGNGLKESDFFLAPNEEVIYRANTALDAAEEAVYALTGDAARLQAIIYVSGGYDVETFPALAQRVKAFARRARENNITIFAIDSRLLGQELLPDPRVDAAMWERYTSATRRSLSLMTDGTGGFVIERANEPLVQDLKRIASQMRQ